MSVAVDTWSKEQDGLKRAELEGMTDLTPEQERTLSEIKGREYAELDFRAKTGKELSEEDRAKLGTYQQRDSAARAALEALHEAAQKAEEIRRDPLKAMCDQFEKENSTFVQDQQAIEAAQKAAAEAAKKPEPMEATSRCPEPGTLPAVASAKAPTHVDPKKLDSSAALGAILQEEKVRDELASMFTTEQLQEVVDASKEAERIKIREASIAQIDAAHHLSEGEKQQLRDLHDGKSGRAMNALMEEYRASTAEKVVHGVSECIGTATNSVLRELAVDTIADSFVQSGNPLSLEEIDRFRKGYDEAKGPMQYAGETLHATAKGVGHYGLGMSEANAETFATATMDGVNIVTAGRMLKPGVAPALKAAGTVVKTATKAAVAALETPLGLVKQLEITRQPGTMSMGGIGTFKIGTKAPAATALESTVSGAPVKLEIPNTGKGKNNLKPDPDCYGKDHSVFKRDADGNITNYATFKANPRNPSTGVEPVKRVDLVGDSHTNSLTREKIPTPHVQGKEIRGGVRPAEPHEIPKQVVKGTDE